MLLLRGVCRHGPDSPLTPGGRTSWPPTPKCALRFFASMPIDTQSRQGTVE